MDADDLEDVITDFVAAASEFVGVEIDVDDADELSLGIDDRQREEPVKAEELAGFQHRGIERHGDDRFHHDVANQSLRGVQQQSPSRHDAEKFALGSGNVEVNDAAAWSVLPQVGKSLRNRPIGLKRTEIGPGVAANRVIQDRFRESAFGHVAPFDL